MQRAGDIDLGGVVNLDVSVCMYFCSSSKLAFKRYDDDDDDDNNNDDDDHDNSLTIEGDDAVHEN